MGRLRLAVWIGMLVGFGLIAATAQSQTLPGGCFAGLDPNGNNVLDSVVEGYICSIESWTDTVATAGRSLLGYLIVIEIFASLWMLFRGGLDELMAAIFRSVFFIGLSYILLLNGLGTNGWIATLLRYFTDTGNALVGVAGGQVLTASNMIEQSLNIVAKIWGAAEHLGLAGLIVVGFSIIVMMIALAIAIAAYVTASIKLVFVVVIGGLFIPFAAWAASRDLAIAYVKAAMGAALEILSVQLLVSIAITFVNSWATIIANIEAARPGWLTSLFVSASAPSLSIFLLLAACSIIFAMLVKELPAWLGSIPSGFTTGSSGVALTAAVTGSAAMVARGVGAIASTVSGTMAAGAVASTASSIYQQARGAGRSVGGAAGIASGAVMQRPSTAYRTDTMRRYAQEKLGGGEDVGSISGGRPRNAHADAAENERE